MLLGEALEAMVKSTHIRVTNGRYRDSIGTIYSVKSYWANIHYKYAADYLVSLQNRLDCNVDSIAFAVNGKRIGQVKIDWVEILSTPQEHVVCKDKQSATLFDIFNRQLKVDQTIVFSGVNEQKVGVIKAIFTDGTCNIDVITTNQGKKKNINAQTLDGNCIVLDDETQKYLLMEKLKS